MNKAFLFILTFFAICITRIIVAQQNEKPCTKPEASQFDFWIGEWKVEWTGQDGSVNKGSNTIRKILDGCVIAENFNGKPAIPFEGKSFSVYDPNLNQWKQTWVDNNGSYMDFIGEFKDGKMTLWRKLNDKDGNEFMQRMVFYNIQADELDWNWEKSTDDGETWQLLWKLHYTRK